MAIRPSVPEIITVNSEALQTQIRDLLPSQNGFGSELQASNVITPIIDLTAAAEGSGLPVDLARAIAFGSQTSFAENNSNTNIANSPGFYRVIGTSTLSGGSNIFQMTDGLATKQVWTHRSTTAAVSESFDLIFWLAAGETLNVRSSSTAARIEGSIRQVADSTGTLVQPSGYPL